MLVGMSNVRLELLVQGTWRPVGILTRGCSGSPQFFTPVPESAGDTLWNKVCQVLAADPDRPLKVNTDNGSFIFDSGAAGPFRIQRMDA